MGYHRAGFDVVGVDIKPQPHYPFEFVQADAMTYPLDGFDAIHASPPCQDHSALAVLNKKRGTAWMLDATRDRLQASGLPWVIENVHGAPLRGPIWLCGTHFALTTTTVKHGEVWLKRHRGFESNAWIWSPGPCRCYGKLTVPVYGGGAGGNRVNMRGPGVAQASREVMGIDWMTRDELDQAIPPAYTEYIGRQLLAQLAPSATLDTCSSPSPKPSKSCTPPSANDGCVPSSPSSPDSSPADYGETAHRDGPHLSTSGLSSPSSTRR
jgi:DNA (cytosine-5)-methyltransferase 1